MTGAGETIPIVRTGAANLASVCAALDRAGFTPELTESPEAVRTAPRLVLPGVGAFGAVMARLHALGLAGLLRERLADPSLADPSGADPSGARRTLCVCLGMQALAEGSEESPGVPGLGLIPGVVRRFTPPGDTLRVPQLGWNAITASPACRLLAGGHAYFANSYRLAEEPEGWACATADHGGRFVAALERPGVLATQFHPELSGPWGAELIRRWADDEPATAPGRAHAAPAVTPLPRVIPCLDVKDGRVVKGVKFQGLRDAGDPVERAETYERQGADELVILDVSATPEGRANAAHTVAAVRRVLGIPLTVGGGVRTADDAARLLDAGADKVGINTAAVRRPELIGELAERFGVQCTVVAIDAAQRHAPAPPPTGEAAGEPGRRGPAGPWEVVVTSGTERTGIDAVAWCAEAERRGAGEVLLTSWDRDGTRSGYDTALLAAACRACKLPVIASGGVDTPGHMAEGLAAGATGVLAASIFHDGDWDVAGLKRAMIAGGATLRTPPEHATP